MAVGKFLFLEALENRAIGRESSSAVEAKTIKNPSSKKTSVPTRSSIIKGPGFRNDLDVRRVWQCPACGLTQRLTQDHTSARCGCVRDGVPMKLAEEPRSPRIALRADARAVIDRIQAGEVIPRLVSALLTNQSNGDASSSTGNDFDEEGNRRSSRRPEQQDQPERPDSDRPPREERRPPRGENRSNTNSSRAVAPREALTRESVSQDGRSAADVIEPSGESSVSEAVPEAELREGEAPAEPRTAGKHGSAGTSPSLLSESPSTPQQTIPTSTSPSSSRQNHTPTVQSNVVVDDFAAGLLDDELA